MKNTTDRLKAALTTMCVFTVAFFLSAAVTLYLSTLWGGILFCVCTVFIGIPMSGKGTGRHVRMGLFMTGLLYLGFHTFIFTPYSPSATAEPFSGYHQAGRDFSVEEGIMVNFHRHTGITHYYSYMKDGVEYWSFNLPDNSQDMFSGCFVAAPSTALDHLHELRPNYAATKLGYLLPSDEGASAVTEQNTTILLILAGFLLLLLIEELFIAPRKEQTEPQQ